MADYYVIVHVTGKNFEDGGFLRADVLTIWGKDDRGYDFEGKVYGQSARRLNQYVNVHNIYEFGMGTSPKGQPAIVSASRP